MKKIPEVVFFLCVIILCAGICASCIGQNSVVSFPVPDQENEAKPDRVIDTGNIVETQDGYGAAGLPVWLSAFIYGGIGEVERSGLYGNKYFFVSRNRGANLNALNKWASNYSTAHDFPRLASARIEERMISAAALYPDNEYGAFFETFVKKALGSEYPGAVKEDIFWIKTINSREVDYTETGEAAAPAEIYEIFVFLSIDKAVFQNSIRSMMEEVLASVTPTRTQSTAIINLQQIFFEGF